jgi:hypothetical protein
MVDRGGQAHLEARERSGMVIRHTAAQMDFVDVISRQIMHKLRPSPIMDCRTPAIRKSPAMQRRRRASR